MAVSCQKSNEAIMGYREQTYAAKVPMLVAVGRSACQMRPSPAQSRSIPVPVPMKATAEIERELRA